jgi:eukaryotic-like serine/threonine-protein kinase
MNPMVQPHPGTALRETIAYPDSARDSDSGDGSPSARHGERYIFGSNARPLEGYTIKRAIGRGGFGEVYYAVSDAGKEVALKLLLRNVDIEKRGVQQCMNLKSPNLITVYDMKTVEEGDTFVVMEYVAGPSLAQILAQYPDGMPLHEVRMWLKGLVDGVAYLHDHGIVHRDLKPANLFLEEGVVKIGDYGLSKFIANSVERGHSTSVGTCHYMAPEISTGKYQKPIDIYAMGILIYEMLTGRVPFQGESAQEVLMKHLTAQPDLSPLTEPYRSIVARALAKDPARRPQNAIDLLVPGDVPSAPAVRFIGDGKSSPAGAVEQVLADAKSAASPKPADDVLRIGEEEPVFYIGPNTMPPRRGWPWGARGQSPVRRVARTPVKKPKQPRVRPVAQWQPPVPPAPDPLPTPRIRIAEAATSMVLAAPLGALASFPGAGVLGINVPESTSSLVMLVCMTILGVWAILLPTKLWEGASVDSWTRRTTMAGAGLALGGMLLALVSWTNMPTTAETGSGPFNTISFWSNEVGLDPNVIRPLAVLLAGALLFGLIRWEKLTARDRRWRLRIAPLFWPGLVAFLISFILPIPSIWLVVYAVLVSTVVQLVSPWDRRAAAFASYQRRYGRRIAAVS